MALSLVTINNAPTGPGINVPPLAINGVRHFSVDCITQKLSVTVGGKPVQDYDIKGKTSISLSCDAAGFYQLWIN
jgi:hypothetical protein